MFSTSILVTRSIGEGRVRLKPGGSVELRVLDRRMTVVQAAVGSCVASALFVSLLVGILFVAALADFAYARTIALLFIIATALLIVGLVLFLWEVNLAMRSVRVNRALIGKDPAR